MCTYRQFFQVEIINTRKCMVARKKFEVNRDYVKILGHIRPRIDADGNGAVEISGAG